MLMDYMHILLHECDAFVWVGWIKFGTLNTPELLFFASPGIALDLRGFYYYVLTRLVKLDANYHTPLGLNVG